MSKAIAESKDDEISEMLPEYDFRGGVRGKHAQAYREGHTVNVHQQDGTVTVTLFTLAEGAVFLEPDVREFFPDAESVNQTLRSLIQLVPRKSVTERLAQRMAVLQLTRRETEILALIVAGRGNKQIGATLGIGEGTVRTHVNRLLAKLGVADRTEAAVTAIRRGLVRAR
jgi:DNA-binding NarL/FixJ family response regulator